MDTQTTDRLQKSFKLLAPRGEELVDRFYAHLFAENPTLRPMFPKNMGDQKRKLLASLAFVIQNITQPESLMKPLKGLGAIHAEFGTQAEHYPVVRDTLVGVMTEMAGEAWSEQLTEDWNEAIDLVSSVMLEGAKEHAAAHAS